MRQTRPVPWRTGTASFDECFYDADNAPSHDRPVLKTPIRKGAAANQPHDVDRVRAVCARHAFVDRHRHQGGSTVTARI